MLNKILSNFSEDELLEFLSPTSVEFSSALIGDDCLGKDLLSKMVSTTKKTDFIFDVELRCLLIERIPPNVFVELFDWFEVAENDLRPKHYNDAISWAGENLLDFSKKLGLADLYEEHVSKVVKFLGISSIEPGYSLYPYQQDISKKVLASLSEGEDRVLIHLPTGSGKTRTAMNIACEHLRESKNNTVLWLADREELCTQAYEEFSRAWLCLGNRTCTAYGFYSDSVESLGGVESGFVVGGLHKFLSLRNSDSRKMKLLYEELSKSVTLVVFDEAHKSVAPRFAQVVNDFIESDGFSAKLIGLTATPGRSYSPQGLSEEDRKLSSFYHNNKISMVVPGYLSPIDYLVENGYLAKANFKSLNYDHSEISAFELKDFGGSETMKALSNNVERNKKIINTVVDEYNDFANIIVFACTVEHGVNLAAVLAAKGIAAASVDSKNDSSESRRAKIKQYKDGELQVLVNYNVLTAGFDAPRTNVALIAKPMNSLVQYLQMAGRAMRGFKSGGNRECRIYTVMDDIPEFQSVNLAFEYWNDMWVSDGDSIDE